MTVERMLPLYEAKMFHHYDHRWATYSPASTSRELSSTEKQDPTAVVMPRYWVRETLVNDMLQSDQMTSLAFRDICRSTDERTAIAAVLPRAGVGHTAPMLVAESEEPYCACLLALLSSFIFDFCVRQKVGGTHLTYNYFQQFPVLHPRSLLEPCSWAHDLPVFAWIAPRVAELVATANDVVVVAEQLRIEGAPFRWDPERRAILRAELDAAFFHLYDLTRDETDYVMDTFPIVRRKDEKDHGEFRTKQLILEVYDELADAIGAGKPYRTRLDPPPAGMN